MKNRLTPTQRETLKAIRDMHRKSGFPPTQRELVRLLGVSQNAVRERLKALARRRVIILVPRIARGIVVVERN